MPKILINEEDYTNPGAPSGYSNYSVLITGFRGDVNAKAGKTVNSNSNGVYEFSSAGDFEATVGLVNTAKQTENGVIVYHYGNQMAHKLLKLGYTVLYKAIDTVVPEDTDASTGKVSFFDIFTDTFWKPFRDRASYDFRFVSHGLLESVDLSENPTYLDALVGCEAANEALAPIDEAIDALTVIKEAFNTAKETDDTLDEEQFCNEKYLEDDYFKTFPGFKNGVDEEGNDTYYATFSDAEAGTAAKKSTNETDRDTCEATLQFITKHELTTSLINDANVCIANLATYVASGTDESGKSINDLYMECIPGRGDCIALVEVDEAEYKNETVSPESAIIDAIQEVGTKGITKENGKYCTITVPSVVYVGGDKMPGAFHYLACFMNSLQSGFREWYAAAGYTRGVASLAIDHTTVLLGEIAINALEPRKRGTTNLPFALPFACNVIANFRGSYYLWGNRTAHPLDEQDLVASHFLNIRQLCTTIKKQLYVSCRRFTFDPNSDTLWFNFVNAIRPTLDAMKADQGIRDYRILKVTDNTKKATLKAKIRIIPIEAVEDFDLEISLEDSFGETAVTATESI